MGALHQAMKERFKWGSKRVVNAQCCLFHCFLWGQHLEMLFCLKNMCSLFLERASLFSIGKVTFLPLLLLFRQSCLCLLP